MQRDQLQQAMASRMQRKRTNNSTDENSQKEDSQQYQPVFSKQKHENFAASYSIPYLQSQAPQNNTSYVGQRAETNQQSSQMSYQSFQIPSQQDKKQQLNELDDDLKNLQQFYGSFVSPTNQKQSFDNNQSPLSFQSQPSVNIQSQVSPQRNQQKSLVPVDQQYTSFVQNTSGLAEDTSIISMEQIKSQAAKQVHSFNEEISLLSGNNVQVSSQLQNNNRYQKVNQPLQYKNIIPPKPQQSNQQQQSAQTLNNLIVQYKQQLKDQERLIIQYQQECQRLKMQVTDFQQQIPDDEKEQQNLIKKLKIEVTQLRNQMENQNNQQQHTINELVKEVDRLNALNEEKKFIIGSINMMVTKQDQKFDFDYLVEQLNKQVENSNNSQSQQFYMNKIKEAVEDLNFMKEEVKKRDNTISDLKQELNGKNQLNDSKVNNSSLKQEVIRKNQQIEQLNDQLNQMRQQLIQLKQSNLQKSQVKPNNFQNQNTDQQLIDSYEQRLHNMQQQLSLEHEKLLQAEQEYLLRCRQLNQNEEERVNKLINNYDTQIKEMKYKMDDLRSENIKLKDDLDNYQRKYQKLQKQYEGEKLLEYNKRLQQLEDVPQSQYVNQAIERAVTAEKELKEEKAKFQKVLLQNQNQLSSYQQEINSLLADLQKVM